MELKVLGCYGPFPKRGGALSGYLLSGKSGSLLIDMGSGTLWRLLEQGVIPDAVFLSHLHYDHFGDILPYSYTLKESVKVIVPQSDTAEFKLLSSIPVFDIQIAEEGGTLTVKDLKLTFCKAVHSVKTLGVSVKCGSRTFYYSSDTAYDESLIQNIRGADLSLIDAAQKEDGTPHMTIAQAEQLYSLTKKRIIVTHLNPLYTPVSELVEIVKQDGEYTV